MRPRIGGVAELIQHHSLSFRSHLQRKITSILQAAALRRQNDFSTVHPHALLFENSGIFRHDQDTTVSSGSRLHGQRNSGIALARLDQGISGMNRAPGFRLIDHRLDHPILDGR